MKWQYSVDVGLRHTRPPSGLGGEIMHTKVVDSGEGRCPLTPLRARHVRGGQRGQLRVKKGTTHEGQAGCDDDAVTVPTFVPIVYAKLRASLTIQNGLELMMRRRVIPLPVEGDLDDPSDATVEAKAADALRPIRHNPFLFALARIHYFNKVRTSNLLRFCG